MTFLVCMSSWEKWVFPQEVNAFPSPSFSLVLPLLEAYTLPPPQTIFILHYLLLALGTLEETALLALIRAPPL